MNRKEKGGFEKSGKFRSNAGPVVRAVSCPNEIRLPPRGNDARLTTADDGNAGTERVHIPFSICYLHLQFPGAIAV